MEAEEEPVQVAGSDSALAVAAGLAAEEGLVADSGPGGQLCCPTSNGGRVARRVR